MEEHAHKGPDEIGQRIERARKALGLSQTALAEKSGVPLTTLNSIRRGYRRGSSLRLDQAFPLCVVLEISIDYLVGRWTDAEEEWPPRHRDGQIARPGRFAVLVSLVLQAEIMQRLEPATPFPEQALDTIAQEDGMVMQEDDPLRPWTDEDGEGMLGWGA